MDEVTELEVKLWRRYQRITGVSVERLVGLSDVLHILTGPDLLPLLQELIAKVSEED